MHQPNQFFTMDCPICLDVSSENVKLKCSHHVCSKCWPTFRATQDRCHSCRVPLDRVRFHDYRPDTYPSETQINDAMVGLVLFIAVVIMGSFIWIEETCMCRSFEPNQISKTSHYMFGGSVTHTRPSSCLRYC